MAEAIRDAVTMSQPERNYRMMHMRAIVRENNIYKWAAPAAGGADAVRSRFRLWPLPVRRRVPVGGLRRYGKAMPHLLNVWPRVSRQIADANHVLLLLTMTARWRPWPAGRNWRHCRRERAMP